MRPSIPTGDQPSENDLTPDIQTMHWPTLLSYAIVTAIGLIIRWVTMRQFVGHIDEPASLLAIKRVAETGVPVFPSGVLYLQGAMFSYLAAPLSWFYAETALWDASRVLYLALAITIVPIIMKLTLLLTDNLWPAIVVGLLVACDPSLIIWSVTIRPYGLLAAEVAALLLLFALLLRDVAEQRVTGVPRPVYWLPVLVLAGTFTHIGFWLALVALAICVLLIWREQLLGAQRPILISGMLSGAPLVAFLLLGRLVGTGAGTGSGGASDSFVGSHLFSLHRMLAGPTMNWWLWTGNFSQGAFHHLLPAVIVLTTGVLISAVTMRTVPTWSNWRVQATGSMILVHWMVISAVALLVTSDPDPRYLNLILAFGYMIVGTAIWYLWQHPRFADRLSMYLVRGAVVMLLLVPLWYQAISGASARMGDPGGSPDYWNATAWAAENRSEGQVVIHTLPTSAYFWFSEDELEQVIFLAGPAEGQRAQRYIKPNRDGDPGDYWLGLPSIGSTSQLCTTLTDYAGNALIVVDVGRLSAPWALKGDMETAIRGSTTTVWQGTNGVIVLSVAPMTNWTDAAREVCGR
ncbi:MAG: hypothetical protein M9950_11255 [Thermomicrobiales bacterium]|nr:hypothetical protein [Thermomicrobiales bacterium]